jgi:hypothetical protein
VETHQLIFIRKNNNILLVEGPNLKNLEDVIGYVFLISYTGSFSRLSIELSWQDAASTITDINKILR